MTPGSGCRLFAGILLALTALAQIIDEYQVKAAFLYNFAKFVEWPDSAFKSGKDPMHICVLGQDPFGSALEEAVSGKTLLGRSFVVADISDPGRAAECQLLFVGSSERKRLRSIFKAIQTGGVLTVGDTDDFAAQGGMVNLKLEGRRIRLEINLEAAGKAKLRISSKVLNLAQIVKPGAP
jgi:hypothetical protein